MDNYMIGLIIMLVSILVSRAISDNANKKLDQDKKAAIIDLFSKGSFYTYGILILILGLFFLNIKYGWVDYTLAFVVYTIAIVIFFIVLNYRAYKKFKNNGFPDFYIRSYLFLTCIRLLGLVIFFTLLMQE